MKKKLAIALGLALVIAIVVGVWLMLAGDGDAEVTGSYRVSATMTPDQVTDPSRPQGDLTAASGSVEGIATVGEPATAEWTLTYSGMSGEVVAAEVRYPDAGSVSVIQLCAPCAGPLDLITTFPSMAVAQAFVDQALAGTADVVLKTTRNPGGEVRGVLEAGRP